MSVGIKLAILVFPALVLAACEYPGVPHPLAAQVAAQDSAAPARDPTPTGAPNASQAETGPGAASGTVQMRLKDFSLDPDRVTAKAGTITFVLNNAGRYTHDFRVEGQGIDERAPKVGQGRTLDWQISLMPGTYRISCPISNHADRGMSGTLEVVP